MSKFDAERLTREQLVAYVRSKIDTHGHFDGSSAVPIAMQAILDAARVPEHDETQVTVDGLVKTMRDLAKDSPALSQTAWNELAAQLDNLKAVDG